jgi:hypothetical protein
MAIQIIRLSTGEELIGEVSVDESGGYVISKPAILGMIEGEEGVPNMVLQKYLPHSEQGEDISIRINSDHVMFTFSPLSEILNHYNSSLGSGIVTPPTGVIPSVN